MQTRKRARLRPFDYRHSGAYFVTICAAGRSHVRHQPFGTIRAAPASTDPGVFVPNDVGDIITDCWIDIPGHFSTVMIDEFALLPDHFHGILFIESQNTGTAFGFAPPSWLRVAGTRPVHDEAQSDPSACDSVEQSASSPSLSIVIGSFKSAVSRISASARPPGKLWQRGFHDRIIRDQLELDAYRKYTTTNVTHHTTL